MAVQLSMQMLAQRLDAAERVFIAGASGEPKEFTALLAQDARLGAEARIVTSFLPGINPVNLAPPVSGRSLRVFFYQAGYAGARAGSIEFLPMAYSAVLQSLAQPADPIDTLILQVAPPDAGGECSLGAAVEFVPTVLRNCRRVFAIVNPNVPRIPGSFGIAMDRVEAYALSEAPLACYEPGDADETSERIAAHLLALIPSGATLQMGLGKVPARLLQALGARRDLALHSGMVSDGWLDLLRADALRDREPALATVAVGTAHLYPQLERVEGLRLAGVEETHSAAALARLPRFFAINSAIEVDLLGQVNAEKVGGRYVSGPGGLPDFAHAARRCEDGLSIIALNSVDSSSKHSKIVAAFAAGTPVTVPQHDVDVIVTEFGAALLRGCDPDERCRRILAVAHPDHREALTRQRPR